MVLFLSIMDLAINTEEIRLTIFVSMKKNTLSVWVLGLKEPNFIVSNVSI